MKPIGRHPRKLHSLKPSEDIRSDHGRIAVVVFGLIKDAVRVPCMREVRGEQYGGETSKTELYVGNEDRLV